MEEIPLVCDMTVFDTHTRQRHIDNSKKLFQRLEERKEINDGFSFTFPNDSESIIRLAEFVDKERLCCPFLGFIIEIEPEKEKIKLQLYGRKGVKEFIKEEAENYMNK